jgi:hypothetical protein
MSGGLSQQRNIGELIFHSTNVPPQSSVAATVNGNNLDRQAHGMALSAQLSLAVGLITGAPTSFSVSAVLQHAPDNGSGAPGTWANAVIAGSNVGPAAVIAASTEALLNVDLSSLNRWLRLVVTITFVGGTAPAASFCASIVLGGEPELQAV